MTNFAQNLFSGSMSILSSLALLLMMRFPGRVIFFLVLIIWFMVLTAGERYARRKRKDTQTILPILLITVFSFVSLVSIVEWNLLRRPLIGLLGILIFLLFQSIVTDNESFLRIQQKPYRRIMVLIWSFNAFAITTALFALSLFFPAIPFWFVTVAGGIIFGFISFMIWRMYFQLQMKQSAIWIFLIVFLMVELIWSMHFLPFGYLVSGFFITWFWYLLQLLIRFHFGSKDVIWRKQVWFLISNAILLAILMIFFVRWV